MSDKFWETFGKTGGLLDDDTDDDGNYAPWRQARSGSKPDKLLLVPAHQGERWRMSYIQTMNQRYNPKTGQLCLLYPGSGTTVFIDGRGLEELDELIEQRQVRSVHMFDETVHPPVGNDARIVTNITVETS